SLPVLSKAAPDPGEPSQRIAGATRQEPRHRERHYHCLSLGTGPGFNRSQVRLSHTLLRCPVGIGTHYEECAVREAVYRRVERVEVTDLHRLLVGPVSALFLVLLPLVLVRIRRDHELP